MSNSKPLVWLQDNSESRWVAWGAGISYTIELGSQDITVTINNLIKRDKDEPRSSDSKTLQSFDAAMDFVENEHYPHFMSEFVIADSVERTEAWFRKAKPEPTSKDICVQLGCHFEEIVEMLDELKEDEAAPVLHDIAGYMKASGGAEVITFDDAVAFLDSLCDQIVTAIGVGYMMGFDMQGAFNEVIRSNNSKFENGKPIFNEQGKIMKGKDYSEPDLTPFLTKGE